MTHLRDFLFGPFIDFAFMRQALVACLALALGAGPVGVFLILRRMSLVGDAMSHAVLPGAAIGFVIAGLSLVAMGIGGLIAGLLVALLSGLISRYTALREDASFAAFYLMSLALGVLIVSTHGSNVDLIHVLFGTILAVDKAALIVIATVTSLTILCFAVIYRPLVMECFDPGFLRAAGRWGAICHGIFLVMLVANLVTGFQALGTLMSVGLMMLPAAAAKFWARDVWSLMLTAAAIALASAYCGLLISYHAGIASGPAIILVAGGTYLVSLLFGRADSLRSRYLRSAHLTA
ncbi:metal ABC transporter permease [Dongia soli]|uniref:Metal ABC transporter permease n=1 Tax=Dongia soli TaxID=600628 RepID=A0ABU5EAR0_9PROT|nr:metal ABC transporter permease [Dongia soli]MDY0883438.1 metal ABC transporter permease [Dongia soli]